MKKILLYDIEKEFFNEYYYNRGMSLSEITEMTVSSYSTVYRRFKDLGFIARTRKGIKLPPFTEEHKKKMSEAMKGRLCSNELREKRSKFMMGNTISKGITHSIETREKHKKQMTGENNHNWKGGITKDNDKKRNSMEYKFWRREVFKRDRWTCTACNKKVKEINAHHIVNFAEFPEKRFDIENGITLCKGCHNEFHKKYGKENNTQEQITKYINEKQYKDSSL